VFPGLAGLGILDGFALGLPVVAIDLPYHSPEIEYLESGVNGCLLPSGTGALDYGSAIARLLADEAKRQELVRGCRRSATECNLAEMVGRFEKGVEEALRKARGGREGSGEC